MVVRVGLLVALIAVAFATAEARVPLADAAPESGQVTRPVYVPTVSIEPALAPTLAGATERPQLLRELPRVGVDTRVPDGVDAGGRRRIGRSRPGVTSLGDPRRGDVLRL